MDDTRSARDQRLLMFSISASAGFAVLSSVWGIVSGSSMIVFDGLYSFVSIGLSVLAVIALRFSRRGADERYPWGRDAAEPLVVVIKAATLGALCAYAAIGGIVDIANGGREVAVGSAVVYAVVATIGVWRWGWCSDGPPGVAPISSAPRRPSGWVMHCCR